MEIVAYIRSDLKSKFGVPRQAGLAEALVCRVEFTEKYRNPDYLRGIEAFSHLWLIWCFSENLSRPASPTVRPPRLGGNRRMGVFATRSPFRPNPIGLSCVRLLSVEDAPGGGKVLTVAGADLMDGTPLYDIKPYLPSADCRPEATGGFTDEVPFPHLSVAIPPELEARLPEGKRAALREILAEDPRPAYHDDPERVYGFPFADREIRFSVRDGVLTVVSIE